MRRKIYRQDIIDAGLELMFLNGYSATGIKDITEQVGIPKGSFYNHFANKEAFGIEVLQHYCAGGLQMHKDNLLHSDLPFLAKLDKHYPAMIEQYETLLDCKLGCLLGNFSQELGDVNEQFRAVLDAEFQEFEDVIRQCFEEAQAQGELDPGVDTLSLADFVLNSWHGALMRMKSTGTTRPLHDFKQVVFQILGGNLPKQTSQGR